MNGGWSYLRLSERQHSFGNFIGQLFSAYRLPHTSRVENPDLCDVVLSLVVSDHHGKIVTLRTCLLHDIYPGHCQVSSVRARANSKEPQTSNLIVIVGLLLDSNTRSSLFSRWVNLRLSAAESLIPGSPGPALNVIGWAGVK